MKRYLLSFFVLFLVFSFGSVFAENVKIGNKTAYIPDEFKFSDSKDNVDTYINSDTSEAIVIASDILDINTSNLDIDMTSDSMFDFMSKYLSKSGIKIVDCEKIDVNGNKFFLFTCNDSYGDYLLIPKFEGNYLFMIMYLQADLRKKETIVDYDYGKDLLVSIIESMYSNNYGTNKKQNFKQSIFESMESNSSSNNSSYGRKSTNSKIGSSSQNNYSQTKKTVQSNDTIIAGNACDIWGHRFSIPEGYNMIDSKENKYTYTKHFKKQMPNRKLHKVFFIMVNQPSKGMNEKEFYRMKPITEKTAQELGNKVKVDILNINGRIYDVEEYYYPKTNSFKFSIKFYDNKGYRILVSGGDDIDREESKEIIWYVVKSMK